MLSEWYLCYSLKKHFEKQKIELFRYKGISPHLSLEVVNTGLRRSCKLLFKLRPFENDRKALLGHMAQTGTVLGK